MSLELKKIKWTNINWDLDVESPKRRIKGVVNLLGKFMEFNREFYIQNFDKLRNGGIVIKPSGFYLIWTCENGTRYIVNNKNKKEFNSIEEAKEYAQKMCEEMVNQRFLKYFEAPPKRKVLVEKRKRKITRKNKRRPVMIGNTRYWGYYQEVGV